MQKKNDLNIGLVLLAGGFGTRFGGNKQLSAIGPENAIIMDYTIYDAWRIGYSWVTVILRQELLSSFAAEVGRNWRDKIELRYSIQSTEAHIPAVYLAEPHVARRQKPWGTAHALLCAADQVNGPFAVANADDFYGYHGLKEIFFYLHQTVLDKKKAPNNTPQFVLSQAMVGFQLGHTLSVNGAVARGICHTYRDAQGQEWLDNIREHKQLLRGKDNEIHSIPCEADKKDFILADNTPVSMNLFGLQPDIFPYLQQQFVNFLQDSSRLLWEQAVVREFYLPTAIENMLEQQQSIMAMLHSSDPWFGLTYLQDLPTVKKNIEALIATGLYPQNLFAKEMAAS